MAPAADRADPAAALVGVAAVVQAVADSADAEVADPVAIAAAGEDIPDAAALPALATGARADGKASTAAARSRYATLQSIPALTPSADNLS